MQVPSASTPTQGGVVNEGRFHVERDDNLRESDIEPCDCRHPRASHVGGELFCQECPCEGFVAASLAGEVDCVVLAWCAIDPDSVEETKRTTHDAIVHLMGDRRSGPVQWRVLDPDEGNLALDAMIENPGVDPLTDELFNYYRQLRGCLREHGGFLIVASAPGRKT